MKLLACANVTIFAASLPRVYCACTTFMEMLRRLAHDLRVPSAFQVRSPNLGVCFEHVQNKRRDSAIIGDHGDHSTMSGVSIPRFLARSGPIFRRRRRAVRTPPRCDGGITLNNC